MIDYDDVDLLHHLVSLLVRREMRMTGFVLVRPDVFLLRHLDATGRDPERSPSAPVGSGCRADDICVEGGLSAAGSTTFFSLPRRDAIRHDIWPACWGASSPSADAVPFGPSTCKPTLQTTVRHTHIHTPRLCVYQLVEAKTILNKIIHDTKNHWHMDLSRILM